MLTKHMMKTLAWGLAGVLLATPSWAQAPYVTGAIGGEVVRSTSVTSSGSTFAMGSGESWSGAVRVGSAGEVPRPVVVRAAASLRSPCRLDAGDAAPARTS